MKDECVGSRKDPARLTPLGNRGICTECGESCAVTSKGKIRPHKVPLRRVPQHVWREINGASH